MTASEAESAARNAVARANLLYATEDGSVRLVRQKSDHAPAILRMEEPDGLHVTMYGLSAIEALELAAALLTVAADDFTSRGAEPIEPASLRVKP